MTGMGGGIPTTSAAVVSSFHAALEHQLLALFVVLLVAVLAWNLLRTVQYRRALEAGDEASFTTGSTSPREPAGRVALRWCFGGLWVLDGLLQLQSSMPLGLPSGVFAPAGSGGPTFVSTVVHTAIRTWSDHPVTAATAAVWIQLGLGALVIVAPRGRWSRVVGAATAGWGLVVWAFGEGFGGVFTPGASVLFGLPGAALLYVAAGVVLALPESSWRDARFGRRWLAVLGFGFVAAAVLQAWPGRGTWVGQPTHGDPGPLASMLAAMSSTPQPSLLSGWVGAFGRLDDAHGFEVNLVVVVAFAAVGAALVLGRGRVLLAGVVAAVVLCAATWVLVQDFGFLGGVGTDPNSMPPLALLVVCGYVAVRRPSAGAHDVLRPASARARWLDRATPGYLLRLTAGAVAAVAVVVGAAPMALAASSTSVDSTLATSLGAAPQPRDYVAPDFSLRSAAGGRVTLSGERGKVVVLTFLDPVCTTDCPLVAQELASADRALGDPSSVAFVAIDLNPTFRSRTALQAFDRQESLTTLRNWSYLTGSIEVLEQTWARWGVQAAVAPAGAMVQHSDVVFLIDGAGVVRDVMEPDLGDASALTGSVAALVAQTVRDLER